MALLASLLGLLVGLSLGLLGGGGSVLTVPILVYLLGLDVKVAVAASLLVVGLTSLLGAGFHAREGNVQGRIALSFGLVAMVGAFGGARLATLIPGPVQLVLFAAVMLAAAVLMFRGRTSLEGGEPAGGAVVLGTSLGVGVLTGVVGVGGGFMIVPALVLLLGLPMKEAVGTSLVVIFLNAVAGFAGYLGQVELPWMLLTGFAALSMVGILLGGILARRVSPDRLRQGFAVFLVVMAVTILLQNAASLTG